MVIDSHTHAFPSEAILNPEGWATRHNEDHWKQLVIPANGSPSLQGWVNREQFLSKMREDRVEGVVLLGWYWQNPDSCLEQNEEIVEWRRSDPGKFRALASVHPKGPSPEEMVTWAVDHDFSGFGEILPQVQNSNLGNPFWNELASIASDAGLLFNFHVTEPVGRFHSGKIDTPFSDLQEFILRHPDLKIVLSHWGAGLFLHELNPYIRNLFRNVYYDSAASPLLYEPSIFENACHVLDPRKILFGSDYPLRLYPRSEKKPGWSRFLREIQEQQIEPSVLAGILHGNANSLFGFGR